MIRTTALIAAWLSMLVSWGAQAQETGMPLRMDSGFYVGWGVGRSKARDFCTNVGGSCDANDISWNAFAGYKFNRHFAVEGGYADLGEAKSTGFIGGVSTQVTSRTTAVELVAVGLLPLTDQFSLYGKGGFFRYDSDGTSTGGLVGSAGDTGTELTFGLGAEYGFASGIGLRVEWQRYVGVGSGLFGAPKADISVLRTAARYKF